MFQKFLVMVTASAMVLANTAEAACHGPELFHSIPLRSIVFNYRGQLPPAPTAVPSPAAPQNLGELHERMTDALVYALGRNKTLPSYTLTLANSAAQSMVVFGAAQSLGVPAAVTAVSSPAVESQVRLRFITENGLNTTCYYDASNGSYAFSYCVPTEYEPLCDSGWRGVCRNLLDVGIKAGDAVIARAVQLPRAAGRAPGKLQAVLTNVNTACGGLALSTTHLLQNVTCNSPNHVGFEVVGNGKYVVDGHGFSVKSPFSEIGLFVMGDNGAIRNIDVSNVQGGYGLMAYDVNGLELVANRFRQNLVGANIYTDHIDTTKVLIAGNDMSGNAFSALILSGDGKQADNPTIELNNFSNTGGYAVSIDAKNASFSGSQRNVFTGSKDALYLLNGNFSVSDLDLSRSGATGPQIFADSAKSLKITDTNLSYLAPAASSQERVALQLYRVGSVSVNGLKVTKGDVGFKVTTEEGTSTAITLVNSTLTNQVVAAVMLQSWDSTQLGKSTISGNNLTGAPKGYSIWQVNNVQLGAGSVVSNNKQ